MKDLEKDTAIELPLVKLDKTDVLGALFCHTDNVSEMYKDALLKLQTWIINFAEEQVKPLRESELFTEEEIEELKAKSCVISPITLTLYLHWLQMEDFIRMTDAEKEAKLLERFPDKFKARYRKNASCRNAREPKDNDEETNLEVECDASVSRMSFNEWLKVYGRKVLKWVETKKNKEM